MRTPWKDDPAWREAQAIYLDPPGGETERLITRLDAIRSMYEIERRYSE